MLAFDVYLQMSFQLPPPVPWPSCHCDVRSNLDGLPPPWLSSCPIRTSSPCGTPAAVAASVVPTKAAFWPPVQVQRPKRNDITSELPRTSCHSIFQVDVRIGGMRSRRDSHAWKLVCVSA